MKAKFLILALLSIILSGCYVSRAIPATQAEAAGIQIPTWFEGSAEGSLKIAGVDTLMLTVASEPRYNPDWGVAGQVEQDYNAPHWKSKKANRGETYTITMTYDLASSNKRGRIGMYSYVVVGNVLRCSDAYGACFEDIDLGRPQPVRDTVALNREFFENLERIYANEDESAYLQYLPMDEIAVMGPYTLFRYSVDGVPDHFLTIRVPFNGRTATIQYSDGSQVTIALDEHGVPKKHPSGYPVLE